MPLSNDKNKKQYTADGIQTTFPFPYMFFKAEDLEVYIGSTLKTITTDYAVSGIGSGFANGANVVFVTAPAAGSRITIVRVLTIEQPTDYKDYANFPNAQVNKDLDRRTMIEQQIQEHVDRQLAVHISEAEDLNLELPPSDTWPNQFLGFDAEKKLMVGRPVGVPASSFMASLLDDPDADVAAQTLFTPANKLALQKALALLPNEAGVAINDLVKSILSAADAPTIRALVGAISQVDGLEISKEAAGKETVITNSTVLEVRKKYRVRGQQLQLSLPAIASEGDIIEIATEDPCTLLQTDAEHVINYKNKAFTTQGVGTPPPNSAVSGCLLVPPKTRIRLVFQQNGYARLNPPAVIPALPAAAAAATHIAWSPDGAYLAVVTTTSPYCQVYKRTYGTETFVLLGALPALNGTPVTGIAWSPDGTYLAAAVPLSPCMQVYKRTGNTFALLPALPALAYAQTNEPLWSPDGIYLAGVYISGGGNYMNVYKRSGDSFTLLNPPALTTGGRGGGWSADGSLLVCGSSGSPYIAGYRRQGDSFAPLAAAVFPALSTGVYDIKFSPDGQFLALVSPGTTNVTILKRTGGDSWQTLVNTPSAPNPVPYHSLAWSPDSSLLAVNLSASPYVMILKRMQDSFVALSAMSALGSVNANYGGASFSPDGAYVAFPQSTSPYVAVYRCVNPVTKAWNVENLDAALLALDQVDFMFK